jgi:hypothetical protein
MVHARACTVAYHAGVTVGAVDIDRFDTANDESERLQVVRACGRR